MFGRYKELASLERVSVVVFFEGDNALCDMVRREEIYIPTEPVHPVHLVS
jgi:hypothetical protein